MVRICCPCCHGEGSHPSGYDSGSTNARRPCKACAGSGVQQAEMWEGWAPPRDQMILCGPTC